MRNNKSECTSRKLTNEEKIKYNIDERKNMNKVLNIDSELRDLLPPLSSEEFELLEENIKTNGCIDPIVTWQEYIIDGHNRYSICTKHNILFQTIELGFKTKDDVIQWMVETQLGRRNLSPLQRVQIAEKYRPIFVKKAQEKEYERKTTLPKSAKSNLETINTRDELAKIAKVGHDTYNKAKKIVDLEEKANKGEVNLTNDQKEVIEKAKKDEIKVNSAFNELFGKLKAENRSKQGENISEPKVTEIKLEIPDKQNKTIGDSEPIDNIKEIIKDIKTPKYVEVKVNLSDELDCFYDNVTDFIETISEVLFERYDIEDLMSSEEKDKALIYTQELVDKLNKLNNKIKTIKIKENK